MELPHKRTLIAIIIIIIIIIVIIVIIIIIPQTARANGVLTI